MPIPDANTIEPGEPLPLTAAVPVPAFPVDQLPPKIAAMVAEVAEATQTDPAMPGTSALAALSACTGGHAVIEIRPGWREPLHLYTATIARPGERKSAVQQRMTAPILAAETDLVEKAMPERVEAMCRKDVATRAADQARSAAAKSKGDQADSMLADAIGAEAFAAAITVPPIPRLVADDITPEAAASLLAEQAGRLAIVSAEGGIFDIIAGRYSAKLPNLDLWLKGHSGDPLRVDRKGRDPEHIPRPALTLGLMIQPAVVDAIGSQESFRGRGLLARFLYACPTSKVGHRKIAPDPVSEATEAQYSALVRDLATGMAQWAGDPAVLTLTDAAQRAIRQIEASIEPTLAGDGALAALADWGSKYAGAIGRLAGIIHLGQHGADSGPRTPVTAETVLAAYRVGGYFQACAINVFADIGTDQSTAAAAYLLDRIRSLGADELSERDIHIAARSRFATKADLLPVLDRLIEHGWLVPQTRPESTGGRPASPRYKVAI